MYVIWVLTRRIAYKLPFSARRLRSDKLRQWPIPLPTISASQFSAFLHGDDEVSDVSRASGRSLTPEKDLLSSCTYTVVNTILLFTLYLILRWVLRYNIPYTHLISTTVIACLAKEVLEYQNISYFSY